MAIVTEHKYAIEAVNRDTPIELPFAVTRAARVTISKRSVICFGCFRNQRRFASMLGGAFAARPCAAITSLLTERKEIVNSLRMSYSKGQLYRLVIGYS